MSDKKNNVEQAANLESASNEEYTKHMVTVFGRYAANAQSVINLLEQGQHVAAWKKMQGIRDAMVYYKNASNNRVNGASNESVEK